MAKRKKIPAAKRRAASAVISLASAVHSNVHPCGRSAQRLAKASRKVKSIGSNYLAKHAKSTLASAKRKWVAACGRNYKWSAK